MFTVFLSFGFGEANASPDESSDRSTLILTNIDIHKAQNLQDPLNRSIFATLTCIATGTGFDGRHLGTATNTDDGHAEIKTVGQDLWFATGLYLNEGLITPLEIREEVNVYAPKNGNTIKFTDDDGRLTLWFLREESKATKSPLPLAQISVHMALSEIRKNAEAFLLRKQLNSARSTLGRADIAKMPSTSFYCSQTESPQVMEGILQKITNTSGNIQTLKALISRLPSPGFRSTFVWPAGINGECDQKSLAEKLIQNSEDFKSLDAYNATLSMQAFPYLCGNEHNTSFLPIQLSGGEIFRSDACKAEAEAGTIEDLTSAFPALKDWAHWGNAAISLQSDLGWKENSATSNGDRSASLSFTRNQGGSNAEQKIAAIFPVSLFIRHCVGTESNPYRDYALSKFWLSIKTPAGVNLVEVGPVYLAGEQGLWDNRRQATAVYQKLQQKACEALKPYTAEKRAVLTIESDNT